MTMTLELEPDERAWIIEEINKCYLLLEDWNGLQCEWARYPSLEAKCKILGSLAAKVQYRRLAAYERHLTRAGLK